MQYIWIFFLAFLQLSWATPTRTSKALEPRQGDTDVAAYSPVATPVMSGGSDGSDETPTDQDETTTPSAAPNAGAGRCASAGGGATVSLEGLVDIWLCRHPRKAKLLGLGGLTRGATASASGDRVDVAVSRKDKRRFVGEAVGT